MWEHPAALYQELSRRIATAARAAIVVGDVFEDEAAGELQLRYMACLDGAPLDKAARTHEKLRTLAELMSPFASPVADDGILLPISIEVCVALVNGVWGVGGGVTFKPV